MPDVTALAGILEYHLGSDLMTVIGSRPMPDATARKVRHQNVSDGQKPTGDGPDAAAASGAPGRSSLMEAGYEQSVENDEHGERL